MKIGNSTSIVSKEKLRASLELIPGRLQEVERAVEREVRAYEATLARRAPIVELKPAPIVELETVAQAKAETPLNGDLDRLKILASIQECYEGQKAA